MSFQLLKYKLGGIAKTELQQTLTHNLKTESRWCLWQANQLPGMPRLRAASLGAPAPTPVEGRGVSETGNVEVSEAASRSQQLGPAELHR